MSSALPDLQMSFLQTLMNHEIEHSRKNNASKGFEPLSSSWKIKFLELICLFKPDYTLMALKKYSFDIEAAQKICIKFGNNLALAYLKERENKLESAIRIYMKVYSFYSIGHHKMF